MMEWNKINPEHSFLWQPQRLFLQDCCWSAAFSISFIRAHCVMR